MKRRRTVFGGPRTGRPGSRGPGRGPWFFPLAALIPAAAVLLLAGCGTSGTANPDGTGASVSAFIPAAPPSGSPAPPSDGPAPPSDGPVSASAVTGTVTSTVTPPAVTAQPPPATNEPAAADGSCPYLTDEQVADINGQHTGRTQIIAVAPHPVCVFTRSDGGWLATVRIIEAPTPAEAVAAVDQHVPIDTSSPATQPAGWAGGAVVLDDRSVYAVAKGRYAVVAESNQLQTIKGRQMAITTISTLGL